MADENITVDNLESVPTGQMSEEEMDNYNGVRTKIADVQVEWRESRWDKGQELPNGETVKVPRAIVYSESLGSNALGDPIVVREEFPLKQHPTKGSWGPSEHPDAKARKFLNYYKSNSFKDVIGRDAVVVKKVRSGTGKPYLGYNFGG
jgi:hypothetical protein